MRPLSCFFDAVTEPLLNTRLMVSTRKVVMGAQLVNLPTTRLSLSSDVSDSNNRLNMPKAKLRWICMKCWTSAPHRSHQFWLLRRQPHPIAAGPLIRPHSSLMEAPAAGSLSLYSISSEILMLPSLKSSQTIQHLM